MTILRKIALCLLLSALLFAGIVVLVFTGIFDYYKSIVNKSVEILIIAAVFLTLFLIIFFCFNLRRDSTGKIQPPAMTGDDDDEKLEEVGEVSPLSSMDSRMDSRMESRTESQRNDDNESSGEAAQLEAVGGLCMFRQPFSFTPNNPGLLQESESQAAGISGEVVYEQNGIHYINNDVFINNKNIEKEFNDDFAKLVESVVNKD